MNLGESVDDVEVEEEETAGRDSRSCKAEGMEECSES